MHPRAAILSEPRLAQDRRATPRRIVSFGLDRLEARTGSTIIIQNLSRTGMLFRSRANLAVGEVIELDIPEAGLVEARIVRQVADRFGAEFTWPITGAAVAATLLVAPPAPTPATEFRVDADREPLSSWLVYAGMMLLLLAVGLFLFALAFLPIAG